MRLNDIGSGAREMIATRLAAIEQRRRLSYG
jgi:hypothetical protein